MKTDGRRGHFNSVRIPRPLYLALKQIAKIERRSVSKVAMLMIEKGLGVHPNAAKAAEEIDRMRAELSEQRNSVT